MVDTKLEVLPRAVLVERARALETVLRIAEEMALGGSVVDLAERFVRAVATYTRFASIVFLRFEPTRDEFVLVAQHGFDESTLGTRGTLPLKGSLTGAAAERGELLTSSDVETDDRLEPETATRLVLSAYKTAACVPVIHGGELLGSFNLLYPSGTGLQDSERGMLGALANNLGVAMAQRIAVERERELDRQARRAQQLESLGVLAGGIAHDFNNLLMGIVGNIELAKILAEEASLPEIVESLSESLSASARATELIKQLLTFARGGSPSLEVTDTLGRILAEVASFAARGSSVRCDVEVEEPLGVVEIDVGQIGQVIQNLVLNACQASLSGGVVTVHARRIVAKTDAPHVHIEVRDKGHGIAPEHRSRIFEPFFTARPAGTGLGLAVCHSIVHRHGGRIFVDSVVGEGTTFTIELPATNRAVAVTPSPGDGIAQFSGRALVMDDDDRVRVVVERMLRQLGFEVDAAHHGAEALELGRLARATGAPYRVALLDLTVVGGLGGAEIVDDLRRASPGTRLIAATGYNDQGLKGWDAQLYKPYRLLALSHALTRVLGGQPEPPRGDG